MLHSLNDLAPGSRLDADVCVVGAGAAAAAAAKVVP